MVKGDEFIFITHGNFQISIHNIVTFCDQGFPEGLRIEYKRDMPENMDAAKTICAFANTQGGILLLGELRKH